MNIFNNYRFKNCFVSGNKFNNFQNTLNCLVLIFIQLRMWSVFLSSSLVLDLQLFANAKIASWNIIIKENVIY